MVPVLNLVYNFPFQAVLKILNKPNSVMDWGTYASNAVVSGDSNGLLNLMDNYDNVKEFFAINLDAFITAASLKHFGMENVASIPTRNIIPNAITEGSMIEKQNWLNNEVCVMLDKYVMDNVNELQDIQGDLPLLNLQHLSIPVGFGYAQRNISMLNVCYIMKERYTNCNSITHYQMRKKIKVATQMRKMIQRPMVNMIMELLLLVSV